MTNDFEKSLNAEQLQAVKTTEGYVMVFAGAGTGKTHTLISRIAYLISELKVDASNILSITFTKKAANEMRERLIASVGEASYSVHMSTIHSMCSRILRRYIYKLGYDLNFEIIDDEDALKILHDIYKNENIDKKSLNPRGALKAISAFKNKNEELDIMYESIYFKYQEFLKKNNMVDFDDLLILTKQLFTEYPDILEIYQHYYQYILVDEFQDVNVIQYDIINMLAGLYHNLFVVGDDDQSIYSFRGATSHVMQKFMEDHHDATKIILNHNYRSTNAILKGANSMIKMNKIREPKELYCDKDGTVSDVMVKECMYYEDEVRYVTDEIARLITLKYSPNDICVLYRNSALSRNFELSFVENKIPYVIYGGFSFLKRREVKDITSYFRFIIDDSSIVHFSRIINIPTRGIGARTIDRIASFVDPKNPSVLDAINLVNNLNSTSKNRLLLDFRLMILDFQEKINKMPLTDFFDYFLEKSEYLQYLKEEHEEDRISNVLEYKSILANIEYSLKDETLSNSDILRIVFDQVMLDDSLDNPEEDKNPKHVTLSTVHSVKGLEFKVVFVVAMEEGLFPANKEDVDMEEERRIAYVAMTRAKEKLYLTCAKRRLIYGRNVQNPKSRFILEYLVHNDIKENINKANEIKETSGEIVVGSKIHHQNFGYGTVINVDEKLIQVVFERDGSIRKLLKNHPTIKKC